MRYPGESVVEDVCVMMSNLYAVLVHSDYNEIVLDNCLYLDVAAPPEGSNISSVKLIVEGVLEPSRCTR